MTTKPPRDDGPIDLRATPMVEPTYFEEWRKMPREVREHIHWREDYLTARTFGLLRYLSSEALSRLLADVGLHVPLAEWDIQLWPTLTSTRMIGNAGPIAAEPDAVLHCNGAMVLMEAKYVGSRLGAYLSQLGREWLLAREVAIEKAWSGTLLYRPVGI